MKITKLVIGMGIAMLLGSCASSVNSGIELIGAKDSPKEKWGLVDNTGKFVVADEFEHAPTTVYNGVFAVPEGSNERLTVYRMKERPEQIGDLENLLQVGLFSEDMLPVVREDSRIIYYDENGKQVLELGKIDGMEVIEASRVYEGMIRIRLSNGLYGFVDKKGNVKVKPEYVVVLPYLVNGHGVGMKAMADENPVYIFDKNGKITGTLKVYGDVSHMCDEGVIVVSDEKVSLYGFDAELKKNYPSKVSSVLEVTSDYTVFKNDEGLVGVLNGKDEVMVRAKYKAIFPMDNGKFIALKENTGVDLIAKNGDIEKSFDYDAMQYFKKFGLLLGDVSKRGTAEIYFFDEDGKEMSKNSVSEVSDGEWSPTLKSDYIGVEDVASEMINYMFSPTLFPEHNVKIGGPIAEIPEVKEIENTSNMVYSTSVKWDIAEMPLSKYLAMVYFSERVQLPKYEVTEGWFGPVERVVGYQLNPDSKIVGYEVITTIDKPKGMEVFNAASEILKKRQGYKLTKNCKRLQVFEGANDVLMLMASTETSIKLLAWSKEDAKAKINELLEYDNYDIGFDGEKGNAVLEEVPEAVDTVAIDEDYHEQVEFDDSEEIIDHSIVTD